MLIHVLECVVYTCRLMYWFNTVGSQGRPVIEQAWMNGDQRQEIVTEGFFSVDSFAIDYNHNDVVYFTDLLLGLFSMNYDGKFVTSLSRNYGKFKDKYVEQVT